LPAIPSAPKTGTSLSALPTAATLGALGIVYGDIGTSPLYAFREAVKAASVDGSLTSAAVLGALSLIIWSLILVVSLKYAILILRADNRGEGGIVALLALLRAQRVLSPSPLWPPSSRRRRSFPAHFR
jgi:KUP system potassium uptake protein